MFAHIPTRLLLAAALLTGCDGRRAVSESPLPPSQASTVLERFQPPEALDLAEEWYPKDWRVHVFRGLADTSRAGRVARLIKADGLHPGEPVVHYLLSLAYLETGDSLEERKARPHLDRALALAPENGVLKVMDAYLLLREGKVGKARALFSDARKLPGGDFYFARLEEMLLGLLTRTRNLNPYTLSQGLEIYRAIPLPPFEKLVDILYSVFLSPLEDHPYDIRARGRAAAHQVSRLGNRLRVQSYRGQRVFSGGYEQQALGFMFQLRAGEFLTLFYRTFEDTVGARVALDGLMDVQEEYASFMAGDPWQDSAATGYLESWQRLLKDNPEMTVARAVEAARSWPLWKRAIGARYPRRDDSDM